MAVSILAILSYYTAQSIQKAVQSKVKIQGDIERTSSLRDAIKIIERDIHTAFNYRDPNIQLYNKAGKERELRAKAPAKNNGDAPPTGTPATTNPPNNDSAPAGDETEPFQPKKIVILTHLVGDADSLHFTSLNNFRGQRNSKSSDQMEVGYFLESCRNRTDRDKTSQCLIRRTSSIIDDDVTKGGDQIALVENVTRFELRYMGYQENVEWQNSWRSDEGGDDVTKNHFPLAIEVTLETEEAVASKSSEKKTKTTAMTLIAEIRNPNNPPPNNDAATSGMTGNTLPLGTGGQISE